MFGGCRSERPWRWWRCRRRRRVRRTDSRRRTAPGCGRERRSARHAGRDRRAGRGRQRLRRGGRRRGGARRRRALQLRDRRRRVRDLPRRQDGQDPHARLAREVARRDGAEQLLHRRQGADGRAVQRQPLQRAVGGRPGHAVRVVAPAAQVRHVQAQGRARVRRQGRARRASRSTRPSSTRRPRTSRTSTTSRRRRRSTSTRTGRRRTSARSSATPIWPRPTSASAASASPRASTPAPVADAIVKAATAPPTAPTADHAWRPGLITNRDLARYRTKDARGGQALLLRPRHLRHGPAVLRREHDRRDAEHHAGLQPPRRGLRGQHRHAAQLPRGQPARLRRPQQVHRRPVVRHATRSPACSRTSTPPRAPR